MTDTPITNIAEARLARDTAATIQAAITLGQAMVTLTDQDVDTVIGEANAQLSAYGIRLEMMARG